MKFDISELKSLPEFHLIGRDGRDESLLIVLSMQFRSQKIGTHISS